MIILNKPELAKYNGDYGALAADLEMKKYNLERTSILDEGIIECPPSLCTRFDAAGMGSFYLDTEKLLLDFVFSGNDLGISNEQKILVGIMIKHFRDRKLWTAADIVQKYRDETGHILYNVGDALNSPIFILENNEYRMNFGMLKKLRP